MDTIGCVDNTIALASGIYLDLANPRPDQINIRDIAQSLSNICRYGGHCNFYSVAEHSVHCASLAAREGGNNDVIFATLMHDAHEAYIGDMTKPLKLLMPEYQKLEKKIEAVVNKKFGIDTSHKKIIKKFDHQMLKAEKEYLFPKDKIRWNGFDTIKKPDIKIHCWIPNEAERMFFRVFNLLYDATTT